ncbi:hypothetical protein PUN28_005237 [Cardiocondyla obscurior]|uniref:Uncharacterized protein n=1 Tax=Cardiocondyla obscurior TaxID=286306 RepID=A0AAW2GHN1_9HYME
MGEECRRVEPDGSVPFISRWRTSSSAARCDLDTGTSSGRIRMAGDRPGCSDYHRDHSRLVSSYFSSGS